jgi:hypothetical protein
MTYFENYFENRGSPGFKGIFPAGANPEIFCGGDEETNLHTSH